MPNNNNMVLPLSTKEKTDINSVLKYLAVEFPQGHAPEDKILKAIKASQIKCLPKGALFTMITHGLAKSQGEEIHFVIKEQKGGEKVNKKQYSPGVTSGEAKIAEAILDYLGAGLEEGVNKDAFLWVLTNKLPKINKRAKAPLAFKVMLRGKYLEEKENKVFLGDKGKEYLSL